VAWKTLTYELRSSCPLIMHSGATADPLNKFAKSLKEITSKRVKTDADHEEMAHIEFVAGLYMDANGPCLPNDVIEAAMIRAAMKSKEGPKVKSGLYALDHASLEYNGPRTSEGLWADEKFRFSKLVRVGQARVPRMRPIFDEWQATVKFQIEDEIVNVSDVDRWMVVAGTQVGICDWRPQYGRFTAKRIANGS
jgi:hypothetical protein